MLEPCPYCEVMLPSATIGESWAALMVHVAEKHREQLRESYEFLNGMAEKLLKMADASLDIKRDIEVLTEQMVKAYVVVDDRLDLAGAWMDSARLIQDHARLVKETEDRASLKFQESLAFLEKRVLRSR